MQVRIVRALRNPMQSAPWDGAWRIEFMSDTPKTHDPLMGWLSSQDALSTMKGRLSFDTALAAQAFARKQGWSFEIP